MVIWKVGGFVEGANHAQFFATKKEAVAYMRETEEGSDFSDLTLDTYRFPPTRRGVVEAFNDFISETCFNEERG